MIKNDYDVNPITTSTLTESRTFYLNPTKSGTNQISKLF